MAAQAQDILSAVDLTGDQATANVGGEKVTAGTDAMTSNPNVVQQGVVPNLDDLLHHYRRMADHIDGLLQYAVENPITSDDKKFQPFQDFIPMTCPSLFRATKYHSAHAETVISSIEYDYGKYGSINADGVYNILDCFQPVKKIMERYVLHESKNSELAKDSHQKFGEWFQDWYSVILLASNRFCSLNPLTWSAYRRMQGY
ncbi:hypothetical protein H4Q26_001438 [Puccinia striiformis f. sp. tritici PST-130]